MTSLFHFSVVCYNRDSYLRLGTHCDNKVVLQVDLIVWIDWSSLGRLIEWKFDKSTNQYFDQLMTRTMNSLNAPVSLIPEKTVAICWQLL